MFFHIWKVTYSYRVVSHPIPQYRRHTQPPRAPARFLHPASERWIVPRGVAKVKVAYHHVGYSWLFASLGKSPGALLEGGSLQTAPSPTTQDPMATASKNRHTMRGQMGKTQSRGPAPALGAAADEVILQLGVSMQA